MERRGVKGQRRGTMEGGDKPYAYIICERHQHKLGNQCVHAIAF